ncbi:hypothetical protein K7432_015241 [Basidiobolus ranarum]|uniref:Cytochrome P450 n=1 Tax=Basidiobolus ranarum TaxID=34480 RepID=A0ABR2WGG8_9FUNG
MQRMILDVLSQGLFGYDFKALQNPDNQRLKLYNELMKGIFDPTVLFCPILTKLPLPKIKRLMAHMEEFNTLLYLILENEKRECQEKLDYGTFNERSDKLIYSHYIIKEAMRLVPPAVSLATRESTKPVGIRGKLFPTGTKFASHVYSMQRSKSYWSDPEVFKPERFLDEDKLASSSWLAFGTDSRQCIGINFTLIGLFVDIAATIQLVSTQELNPYQWNLENQLWRTTNSRNIGALF